MYSFPNGNIGDAGAQTLGERIRMLCHIKVLKYEPL